MPTFLPLDWYYLTECSTRQQCTTWHGLLLAAVVSVCVKPNKHHILRLNESKQTLARIHHWTNIIEHCSIFHVLCWIGDNKYASCMLCQQCTTARNMTCQDMQAMFRFCVRPYDYTVQKLTWFWMTHYFDTFSVSVIMTTLQSLEY